ncbi:TolC family protein [Massilibacteroides sp.]|uniref:TolC family protein n=1 Tax=Massilibacteroides sp. TaxID=2034766 RepID=UPI002633C680|nr:TolC family protein [Massilibacteroides sp.]MDD4516414.1 TolC family protein [Massilibacteroides sp.]
MERLLAGKKMRFAAIVLLSGGILTNLKAQEPEVLSLDLNQAVEFALSESPTVKVANKEIEKKKYAKKGAYAALFPQVDFGADYSRTLKKQVMYMDGAFDIESMMSPVFNGIDNTFANSVSGYKPGTLAEEIAKENAKIPQTNSEEGISVGRDNNWSFGFTAGMPLINVSLWKSLSISGIDVELAVEQARSSKIDMVNQVRKSFYAVLLANDSYKVFKESYDNAMENYTDIKKKYEQGLVAEYDLIRAEVSVRNVEPNMLQAQNALGLAQWQLKALMGMDLEQKIICSGELKDFEPELFADYVATDTTLNENTNLKQLDIQGRQLDAKLKMEKFDYLPTLSLSGLYQWNSMNNNFKFGDYKWNPYSMVGLKLTIPVFSGGSRLNKVRQTRVTIEQLSMQRDDLSRNLKLAVKQSLDNMATCVKRFDAAQKGVKQAERGYEISQKRYDTGAGTLLEMNDSELALTQSKLNFNQAIYDYMVAKSELEKILGRVNNKSNLF